jgi:hypothetical protein
MAAFTAEDPDDRTAFDVHMAKVRTSPEDTIRAITVDRCATTTVPVVETPG